MSLRLRLTSCCYQISTCPKTGSSPWGAPTNPKESLMSCDLAPSVDVGASSKPNGCRLLARQIGDWQPRGRTPLTAFRHRLATGRRSEQHRRPRQAPAALAPRLLWSCRPSACGRPDWINVKGAEQALKSA